MSLDSIRIGVIGAGQIGKRHVEEYSAISGAQVVALADLNEAEAARVAGQHGIESVYADYRELLAREDIDAVDVCLHNQLHAPVTIAALEAGKHVYCEKPMAATYADARAMWDAALATGKKLSIQLWTLFQDETHAARELIEAGTLGAIYHARSAGFRRRGRPFVDGYGAPTFVQHQSAGGGALFDMGVYHIARALWLMGNPAITRVSGQTHQKIEMDAARKAQSGFDVEEFAVGLVHFENGATLELVEAWAVHLDDFGGSYVLGDKGGMRFSPFKYFFSDGDLDFDASANLDQMSFRRQMLHGGERFSSAQKHWIAALRGECDLWPTAQIALATMLISEGIYRSARESRELRADEIEREIQ